MNPVAASVVSSSWVRVDIASAPPAFAGRAEGRPDSASSAWGAASDKGARRQDAGSLRLSLVAAGGGIVAFPAGSGRRGGGVRVRSQATVRRAAGARVIGSALFEDAENVASRGDDRVDFSSWLSDSPAPEPLILP